MTPALSARPERSGPAAPPDPAGPRSRAGGRLAAAARLLTTPLLPEDYLGLLNPLWSTAEPRGRVEALRHEAPGAATLVIRPGTAWRGHRPGQWVKIGVDIGGVRHWRTFSLSSPPRPDGRITITVKAARDGFVSAHLVHRIRPGAIVRLGAADGGFTLSSPVPSRLLFVTAGSGITPVMAMLRHLADTENDADITVVHSDRHAGDVIFGGELRRMTGIRLHERHTSTAGRLAPSDIAGLCPDWAERDAWACGPSGMLDALAAHWRAAGIEDRLRIERFRPAPAPGAGGEGGRVRFTESGVETDADGSTPLLDAGERAGALLPSGCRMGICHSCVGRLRSGKVRDLRTGQVHGDEGEIVQTCVSAAAGPVDIEL
ncbi:2Fe-2S iron-sulfur cluster binding domain-containing protein [Actinomadura sp. LD22]|uniref:2Fe-2S iron-sulfur cluster binding domain-containing protein n=1 Tax=Actinomadura physcomitrii TaxID=2650748 RepID=A0A6I4MD36_9ACTN|nr:ferredoxin reductase [Actinomadura physcomitrii]MWA02194.1 2Fe-2S iron-sulfur cluster binding domain-containing protein [Actinomadura physcomitrii]